MIFLTHFLFSTRTSDITAPIEERAIIIPIIVSSSVMAKDKLMIVEEPPTKTQAPKIVLLNKTGKRSITR